MRHLNNSLLSATLLSVSVLLTACGGDSDYDFSKAAEVTPSTPPHGPVFDPAGGKIPTPNNLLLGKDGTLNIPNDADGDGKPDNPVVAAINTLDGASTSNPMIVEFGMPLDAASIVVGDSVRIFEVTTQGPAITGVVSEIPATEVFVKVLGDTTTLALVPFPPLKESSTYAVVLTNGIKDTSGKPAQAPSAYSLARSSTPLVGSDFEKLEPVRQHIGNIELIAKSRGVDTDTIVLSWAFTTQSTTAILNGVAANAKAGKVGAMVKFPASTAALQPAGIDYNGLAFAGAADIYTGTLDVPYYLEAPSAQNPIAPLNGYWKGEGGAPLTRYKPTPLATKTMTIPVMMTLPNASSGKTKPSKGWPVVMYQHGITRVRTDMLIYADQMAKAGFAFIAIDLPMHGVTDKTNPFYSGMEQTFDVDYANNTTQAAGPDGKIDSSGMHYINLTSLLTSRDNNRQGVSNLLVLRRSLGDIANLDATNVSFIAHSLGGVVGVPYLGVEDKVTPSALVTTGGSITTIIRDSAFYGPVVKGGLAANGVEGAGYERYLQGAQWILDSADPVNYAMDAAMTHPLLVTEVIGDGGIHKPDQTVPNSATETLALLTGAAPATMASNPITVGGAKIIRFIQGDHSSILDPSDDVPAGVTSYINVYTEMHAQLISFLSSGGTKVDITDMDIIKK